MKLRRNNERVALDLLKFVSYVVIFVAAIRNVFDLNPFQKSH